MSVEFSLLELASVRVNETPCDTFNHAVVYAKAADALGFKRFWLAEHHNMQGIASSATAVLIGHIAGNTQRLRVGSGGIMLPNHTSVCVPCRAVPCRVRAHKYRFGFWVPAFTAPALRRN